MIISLQNSMEVRRILITENMKFLKNDYNLLSVPANMWNELEIVFKFIRWNVSSSMCLA